MLRSLSTKIILAIVAAIVLVVAVLAVAWKYYDDRHRIRVQAEAITGGDSRRGEALFIQYGCGSCHAVTGVRAATGDVGPPLDGIATRMIIAGHLANNAPNMEHWIEDPQHVSPGTAMPDLGVSAGDARDITAFLYTRAK
ncbi:MAG TPA: c-type cytochrome [Sphingomicrobium sp.]|nr:c-type cytochrome [Sphingomicrobium sp.]